jgi:hypothetical protein
MQTGLHGSLSSGAFARPVGSNPIQRPIFPGFVIPAGSRAVDDPAIFS